MKAGLNGVPVRRAVKELDRERTVMLFWAVAIVVMAAAGAGFAIFSLFAR